MLWIYLSLLLKCIILTEMWNLQLGTIRNILYDKLIQASISILVALQQKKNWLEIWPVLCFYFSYR